MIEDSSFVEALRVKVIACGDDPDSVCDAFHEAYETQLAVLESDLELDVKIYRELPMPFAALAAAHQAGGCILADGFVNYLEDADASFDQLAEDGLRLLGKPEVMKIVGEVRSIVRSRGSLTSEEDEDHWDRIHAAIEDLDILVGKFLMTWARQSD